MVAILLSHGAKIDFPGQGDPTLHAAASGGSAAIVSMILAAGANIDATNDVRETALHIAAETDERIGALNVLLENGANMAASALFDRTPLDVAEENNCVKAVKALRARGAIKGPPSMT
jgi:ankyrin repeat protein